MQSQLHINLSFIKNLPKPILIVGMAKSGQSCLNLLLAADIDRKDIITYDQVPGKADISDFNQIKSLATPKTLVISPGVPIKSPWIQELIHSGAQLSSELSIAASVFTSEKTIGVTGSLGKSTTVSLLSEGLSAFCPSFFVGGNIGTPLADYAIALIRGVRPRAEWVVLELSSYQLENCDTLSLDFSAITYFDPNHLERYDNLENYYLTKWNIANHTKSALFLNHSSSDLMAFNQKHPIKKIEVIITNPEDASLHPFSLSKCALIGRHNLDNLGLAAHIALKCGWPESSIHKMKQYRGLEHRLETVTKHNGILCINDSKATAIESVKTAIGAAADVTPRGTVIVLLGGRDKNLPWEKLSDFKDKTNLLFVFFGECGVLAQTKSTLKGNTYPNLRSALDHAFSLAKSNDTILLSPGGTSLDEFKNFEDRGHFFKNYIKDKITLQTTK